MEPARLIHLTFDAAHLAPVPCVKVNRGLWDGEAHGAQFRIELTITYRSGGVPTSHVSDRAMSDYTWSANIDSRNVLVVGAAIQLPSPADVGSTCVTACQVYTLENQTRINLDDAILTSQVVT